MDTIQEQIIKQIVQNLGNINIENGYYTDLGLKIYRSDDAGYDTNLNCLLVFPGIETASEKQNYRYDILDLPLYIKGLSAYVTSNTKASQATTIAEYGSVILGDIRSAMGQDVELIENISYIQGGVEDYPEPRKGEKAVVVSADYMIRYRTIKNNPYSQ